MPQIMSQEAKAELFNELLKGAKMVTDPKEARNVVNLVRAQMTVLNAYTSKLDIILADEYEYTSEVKAMEDMVAMRKEDERERGIAQKKTK